MKASVYIAITLDGYIARENGALDWLPGAEVEIDESDNTFDNEDFGYNKFMENIDALIMGRNTYEFVLSSGQWPYANKKVIVLSSTLDRVSNIVPDTVKIRSGSLDEMIITTVPVLIGNGIPLFGVLKEDKKLKLLETKQYSNGFVQSKYSVLD